MAPFYGFNLWSVPGFNLCMFPGSYLNTLNVSVVSSDWDWLDLRGSPGWVLLCLTTEAEPASEMSCFFKVDDGWSTKKGECVSDSHTVITGLQHWIKSDGIFMWHSTSKFTYTTYLCNFSLLPPSKFQNMYLIVMFLLWDLRFLWGWIL